MDSSPTVYFSAHSQTPGDYHPLRHPLHAQICSHVRQSIPFTLKGRERREFSSCLLILFLPSLQDVKEFRVADWNELYNSLNEMPVEEWDEFLCAKQEELQTRIKVSNDESISSFVFTYYQFAEGCQIWQEHIDGLNQERINAIKEERAAEFVPFFSLSLRNTYGQMFGSIAQRLTQLGYEDKVYQEENDKVYYTDRFEFHPLVNKGQILTDNSRYLLMSLMSLANMKIFKFGIASKEI